MRSEYVGYLAILIQMHSGAQVAIPHIQRATGERRVVQGCGIAVNGQLQATAVQAGEQRGVWFAMELQQELAVRRAMGTPAVALCPGVYPAARVHLGCSQCQLAGQGLRHHGGSGHLQTHLLLLEQDRRFARNQRRIQLRLCERWACDHVAQKLHIGRQADDMGLRQRRVHARQRLLTRSAVHDELGDHGVVEGADAVALAHAGINAHRVVGALERGADRQAVDMQCAGGGQKIVIGVLGANAGFDGVAVDAQLVLLQRQGLARGYPQLPLHQVLSGDGLGNRVLHLQTCVHLHKIKLHLLGVCVATGLFDDEFHRTSPHILHRTRRFHRGLAHAGAQFRRHARRGSLFQHFLVAALHRTITLKQVDVIALGIAKHLDLDMARAQHIFLDQHRIITKAVDGFTLAAGKRRRKVLGLVHRTHALAAATGAGFDQHRVANAVGLAL